MLDEGLRQRIAGLAEADEGGLDEAARERIFTMLRSEGPALVQSAKRRRLVATASAFALAAAAAAALLVVRHRSGDGTERASLGARAGEAALACSSRAVAPSASAGFVTGTGGSRLDLGAVAVASASPGAAVRLEEASPCRTLIALESGTVAVHAKDLGGGELRVRTKRGDVVVHGTIFAVTEDVASLEVEVVVGNVTVTDGNGSHSVTTGERLLLSAVGAAQGTLARDRERALRASLGVPEVVGLETLPSTQSARTSAPCVSTSDTLVDKKSLFRMAPPDACSVPTVFGRGSSLHPRAKAAAAAAIMRRLDMRRTPVCPHPQG